MYIIIAILNIKTQETYTDYSTIHLFFYRCSKYETKINLEVYNRNKIK